jgi:hypothetical protein
VCESGPRSRPWHRRLHRAQCLAHGHAHGTHQRLRRASRVAAGCACFSAGQKAAAGHLPQLSAAQRHSGTVGTQHMIARCCAAGCSCLCHSLKTRGSRGWRCQRAAQHGLQRRSEDQRACLRRWSADSAPGSGLARLAAVARITQGSGAIVGDSQAHRAQKPQPSSPIPPQSLSNPSSPTSCPNSQQQLEFEMARKLVLLSLLVLALACIVASAHATGEWAWVQGGSGSSGGRSGTYCRQMARRCRGRLARGKPGLAPRSKACDGIHSARSAAAGAAYARMR